VRYGAKKKAVRKRTAKRASDRKPGEGMSQLREDR